MNRPQEVANLLENHWKMSIYNDIIEPGDAMEHVPDGMSWDSQQEDDRIVWPKKGESITNSEYRELRAYANDHDILLSRFRNSDDDVELMKEAIDDTAKVLAQFPELIGSGRKKLTLMLSDMHDNDFAMVYKDSSHILHLNSKAYRSKEVLAKEYEKLADEGWFVRRTDYHSIVYHELGHMYGNRHGIDGIKIAKNVLGQEKWGLIRENLKTISSHYSVSHDDGAEILPEVFSSYFGESVTMPEFVLSVINKITK